MLCTLDLYERSMFEWDRMPEFGGNSQSKRDWLCASVSRVLCDCRHQHAVTVLVEYQWLRLYDCMPAQSQTQFNHQPNILYSLLNCIAWRVSFGGIIAKGWCIDITFHQARQTCEKLLYLMARNFHKYCRLWDKLCVSFILCFLGIICWNDDMNSRWCSAISAAWLLWQSLGNWVNKCDILQCSLY